MFFTHHHPEGSSEYIPVHVRRADLSGGLPLSHHHPPADVYGPEKDRRSRPGLAAGISCARHLWPAGPGQEPGLVQRPGDSGYPSPVPAHGSRSHHPLFRFREEDWRTNASTLFFPGLFYRTVLFPHDIFTRGL